MLVIAIFLMCICHMSAARGYTKSIVIPHVKNVFVINMERHKKRWLNFVHEYPYNVMNVTRVNAFDGFAMTCADTSAVQHIRAWLRHNKRWSKGDIGCTMSHVGIWQKIAADTSILENEFALVFEDDVIFMPHFEDIWSSINIPTDAGFIYIGGWPRKHYMPNISANGFEQADGVLYKDAVMKNDRGIYAYAISKKTARAFLALIDRMDGTVVVLDHWMTAVLREFNLQTYSILPAIAWSPVNIGSSIQGHSLYGPEDDVCDVLSDSTIQPKQRFYSGENIRRLNEQKSKEPKKT